MLPCRTPAWLERQVIDLARTRCAAGCKILLGRHRCNIARRYCRGGIGRCARLRLLCLLWLYAPCANVVVPATVVFACVDIDGYRISRTLCKSLYLVGLVEERYEYLARILRLRLYLEQYILTCPLIACGLRYSVSLREYLYDLAFEIHNLLSFIRYSSAKVAQNGCKSKFILRLSSPCRSNRKGALACFCRVILINRHLCVTLSDKTAR